MLHSSAAQHAKSRSFLNDMFRSGVSIEDALSLHTSLKKGVSSPIVRNKLRNALRQMSRNSA